MLSRFRGALIYAAICAAVLLLFRERAWQHVATLNGDEWHPIQTFVRAARRADEPICFLPSWTVGHATDQYKFRGIEVLERPSDAWKDRDNPRDFWVVSQFDAFDAGDVPTELYPHRERRAMGGADIWVFRREPFTLPDSLVFHLREARCAMTKRGGERLDLVWNRNGYIIPWSTPNRASLAFLGCRPSEGRIGGRSRYGIWFHPPAPGAKLRLTWPSLEVGGPWLVVSGGLVDRVTQRKAPPVQLRILFDGEPLETLRYPSERGWKTHGVSLGRERVGKTGRLAFEVWAAKNHSRHFIFDATFEKNRPVETPRSRPKRGTTKTEGRPRGSGGAGAGGQEPGEREPAAAAGRGEDASGHEG